MQKHDPVDRESVPTNGGDSPLAPGDYIRPADLHPATVALLKQSLARNQRRRKVFRTSPLRVCLDGEERWPCVPGASIYGPFSVPLSAAFLEVVGEDDDGPLLLAVFPLPEPAWVEACGAQHLVTTLEGGQTVTIEIALSDGTRGEAHAYVIQIAYAESPAV
jgi:hypothetical protein